MNKKLKYNLLLLIMIIFLAGCKKHEDITGDTTLPVISDICWIAPSTTTPSATIWWTTDEPATSQVEYGLTDQYGLQTTEDLNIVFNHEVNITEFPTWGELIIYHFRVKSRDVSGNLSISKDKVLGSGTD